MLPRNLGFPLYDKMRDSEMKKLLSLATAGIIGTATLYSTAQADQLTSADKEFLFNNPSIAKAETLSPEEMKNTEGAWLFGAVIGALSGFAHWATYTYTSHNWDAWGLVEDVWGGALFGLLVPDPVAPVEGWVAATSIGGSSFLGALGGWHDRR